MNGYELKALRKFKEYFQEMFNQGITINTYDGDIEDFDEIYIKAVEKAEEEIGDCEFKLDLYFGIINKEMGK